ncbi:hypothetical protein [Embleya sp. NPDC050493]|uniref:hypothetical protein n=1 Tax=Embleya sp. NPDC050493 TaxID=3363989 RepID=UPI0037981E08
MGIRKRIAAVGMGAAIVVGALSVPAQATASTNDAGPAVAVRAGAAGGVSADEVAAVQWRYTGNRYFFSVECHSAAVQLTYATGWATQCRGPHTDGYYYLWAYH